MGVELPTTISVRLQQWVGVSLYLQRLTLHLMCEFDGMILSPFILVLTYSVLGGKIYVLFKFVARKLAIGFVYNL